MKLVKALIKIFSF